MDDQKQLDIWDELQISAPAESLDEEMFELLSAYLDGECSVKERRLVEAYLAGSPQALGVLADLRSHAALLSHQFEPPASLRTAILAATIGNRKPRTAWRWVVPAGLAAAALFAGLVRSIGHSSGSLSGTAETAGGLSGLAAMQAEPNAALGKKPDERRDLERAPYSADSVASPVRVASTEQSEPRLGDSRLMQAVMEASMAGSMAGGSKPKTPDLKKAASPTVVPAAQSKVMPAAGAGSSVPFPAPQRPDVVAIISDDDTPGTAAAQPEPQPDANESLRAMLKEHNKNRTDLKDADKIQF
jgi:hypothetical protein